MREYRSDTHWPLDILRPLRAPRVERSLWACLAVITAARVVGGFGALVAVELLAAVVLAGFVLSSPARALGVDARPFRVILVLMVALRGLAVLVGSVSL